MSQMDAMIFDEIFTAEVVDRLRRQRDPSGPLSERLHVLTASDHEVEDEAERRWNRHLCARQAAWRSYVEAANDHGVLDGEHGADVRRRLAGTDDDGFRSAMAECMACWFLSRCLRLPLVARPEGRPGRVLEFGIPDPAGDINVEVKAPYAPRPESSVWFGGNRASTLIQACVDEANRQFPEGRRNLLVIVPFIWSWVLSGRRSDFVRALLGEEHIVITIDRRTGRSVGEPEVQFVADGKFLKRWGLEPRFTCARHAIVITRCTPS
jgi:hypothetical protein